LNSNTRRQARKGLSKDSLDPSNETSAPCEGAPSSPLESGSSWSNMSQSPVLDQNQQGESSFTPDKVSMTDSDIMPTNVRHPAIETAISSQNTILDHSSDQTSISSVPSFLPDAMVGFQQDVATIVRNDWNSLSPGPRNTRALANTSEITPESGFWPQNGPSSINWLPDNWIPNFHFESGATPQNYQNSNRISQDHFMSITNILGNSASNLSGETPSFDDGLGSPENPVIEKTAGSGYFYIDGDGARLPRVRKAPNRTAHPPSDPFTPIANTGGLDYTITEFGFHGTEFKDTSTTSSTAMYKIPIDVYNKIYRVFKQTCVTSSYFTPFNTYKLPSVESLEYFIQLYFENFQPILPFIHPATFSLKDSHWLLIMAMAAIGSHYINVEDVDILVLTFHELLRRSINFLVSRYGPHFEQIIS
jgi:hypothetical protein